MHASAIMTVMSYGKFSDRFGGPDQPYEYVDLYDRDTGEMFMWSLDGAIGESRPGLQQEAVVTFRLEKQAKPALARIKKGDQAGQVTDYVMEKLKVKVLGFDRVPASQKQQERKAA
jgi:hypothetical protein